MGDTAVQRWRKYGKDRRNISADDGTRIGWHDVLTADDGEALAVIDDAAVAAVVPSESSPATEPQWEDLAGHAIPVGENGSDIDHLVVDPAASSLSMPSTTPALASGSGEMASG